MTQIRRLFKRPQWWCLAVGMLPAIVFPTFQYLAVAPFGSDVFLWLELVFIIPIFLGTLVLPIAFFFIFLRRFRRIATWVYLLLVVLALAGYFGVRAGNKVRMEAFHQLAERSQPLVQAIRAYEKRRGAPPPDLQALVPDFLPEVPRTGMAAYPAYDYHAGDEATRFNGNPWVLVIYTPSGGINFDQFMYFPLQNYPLIGYGGSLERIRDWAYAHE